MAARVIVEPVNMAVSIEEARTAARIDGSDLDAQLAIDIRAFTKDAEHETGRSLVYQTWRVSLNAFPRADHRGPASIGLPSSPVVSVTVSYIDAGGAEQTLDPADYIVDAESEPGYIVPAPGKGWPKAADRINAVKVEAKCGYGADATAVPDGFKAYILGKIAEKYGAEPESPSRARLLWPYKVFS